MRALALFALVAAAAAGCNSGDCTPSCSPPVFDLSMPIIVDQSTIQDLVITAAATVTVGPGGGNAFVPAMVSIHAGDSVTWNWVTGTHSIVSDDMPPAFAASPVQSAGQFTVAFMNAGTFKYHCGIHGTMMTGTVVVQ